MWVDSLISSGQKANSCNKIIMRFQKYPYSCGRHFRYFKGIQDIPGFRIPGIWFQSYSEEFGFWIPIVSKIPDSLSCIPDSTSKILDSGIRIPLRWCCDIVLNSYNIVPTLLRCAKNRRCESSRVTSPLRTATQRLLVQNELTDARVIDT